MLRGIEKRGNKLRDGKLKRGKKLRDGKLKRREDKIAKEISSDKKQFTEIWLSSLTKAQ